MREYWVLEGVPDGYRLVSGAIGPAVPLQSGWQRSGWCLIKRRKHSKEISGKTLAIVIQ
jgi:hypothetical protein